MSSILPGKLLSLPVGREASTRRSPSDLRGTARPLLLQKRSKLRPPIISKDNNESACVLGVKIVKIELEENYSIRIECVTGA